MKSLRTSSTPEFRPAGRVLAGLLLLTLLSAVLSLCLGSTTLSPALVPQALLGQLEGSVEGQIIQYVRLPRTCGCLLAGMALAVSGAVIQSVLNNPLAAPNIIGVNSGAGLMVVLCSALFPQSVALTPLAAFLGAFLGVLLVLFIAERTGASRITLVLAGVAVSNIFSAGIDAVVTFFPDALLGYSDFRIGGLNNLSMDRIVPAFWVVLVSLILLISLSGEMDILALGRETAQSLGLPVKPLRLALLALAAALAGAAVSFAGLLGFVGLIVPHIMRRTVGEDSRPLLASCALGGASLLTLCDLLSRVLFAPYEIPVGIVLSLAGGPFFIWLLLRQRGAHLVIQLQNISAGYGGPLVVQDVSLDLNPGKVLVLLGPNGCGKSTLLKVIAGLQPPAGGQVLVDGQPAGRLTRRQLAQTVTYLPQSRSVPNITAYRMVLHGRFPYLSYPRRYRPEDHAAARKALEQADAWELARLPVQTLSGGQRQKVYLAMALAQDTQTILMDEPTTYLDIQHQLDLMAFSQTLAREGKAVVLVLHDLCLALRFAHRGAVLSEGRLLQTGTPEELFSSGILTEIFRTPLNRIWTEGGWRYYYD